MPRSVPRRGFHELLHWETCGFSPWALNSSSAKVRANAPRSSSNGSTSSTITPSRWVGEKITRVGREPTGGAQAINAETATLAAVRILVTGHDGYIGSVLVPLLLERGHEPIGVDTCFYDHCVLGEPPRRIEVIKG